MCATYVRMYLLKTNCLYVTIVTSPEGTQEHTGINDLSSTEGIYMAG